MRVHTYQRGITRIPSYLRHGSLSTIEEPKELVIHGVHPKMSRHLNMHDMCVQELNKELVQVRDTEAAITTMSMPLISGDFKPSMSFCLFSSSSAR